MTTSERGASQAATLCSGFCCRRNESLDLPQAAADVARLEAVCLHELGQMGALETDLAVEDIGSVAAKRLVGAQGLSVVEVDRLREMPGDPA